MKSKIRRNKIIIISMFILGAVGLGLISYDYVLSKINLTFETVNLQLYGNNEPQEVDEVEVKQPKQETQEPETSREFDSLN